MVRRPPICPICSFEGVAVCSLSLNGHAFARAKVAANGDTMDWDQRWPKLLAGVVMTLCLSAHAIAEDVESPKDDIAAQIRVQGYACDQPQSAERDVAASTANEVV